MINVGELKHILAEFDDTDLVVLAKDAEDRHGYSPLESWSADLYVAKSTWSGTVHPRELTHEDRELGWTEADLAPPNSDPRACVTLVPVN